MLDPAQHFTWRTILKFLLNLGIKLPNDPAISVLDLYPEKITIQKCTCTPVFIAALFIIDRTRKQPKCPFTDEWVKNLWYIYTIEYYSAIKEMDLCNL